MKWKVKHTIMNEFGAVCECVLDVLYVLNQSVASVSIDYFE